MHSAFASARRHARRLGPALLILCTTLVAHAQSTGTHVVRPGDTLTAVARLYDTTVPWLVEENGLASDLLRVGVVLRVPTIGGWRTLAAAADESWVELALRTGLAESTLRAANPGLTNPGGHEVRVPPADGSLTWPRPGDDLVGLATRLGVSPGSLATANGLSAPFELSPERPLLVPDTDELGSAASVNPVATQVGSVAVATGVGGAAVAGPERRAAHVSQRNQALARLDEVLAGLVLSPPDDGFAWPLAGVPRLTSLFGWRPISVGGNRYHQGVDLGAATGTPVRASRGGVVTRASWVGAYGYAVYLSHDGGYETRYAHLSRLSVRLGETVATGDEVGAVGSTGASTGPHLHFEARLDGRALDPLLILPRDR